MTTEQEESRMDLLNRLDLVESMIQAGRRRTEYWGWTQVLWGVAYLVAIGWSQWSGRSDIAWSVTMIVAAVITIAVASSRKRAALRQTTVSRSLGAIWIAVGTALFIYCFSTSISGHSEPHAFLATVEILLGAANFASSLVLRWRVQFMVAAVWWISAVATCFVGTTMVMPILIADTWLCLIGFGLYLMYCERRDRRNRNAVVQHG